jgi:hypothetical protein
MTVPRQTGIGGIGLLSHLRKVAGMAAMLFT